MEITKEHVVDFKKSDTKQQIVFGEVYVPNRKDTDGNFMTAEIIEKGEVADVFHADKSGVQQEKHYLRVSLQELQFPVRYWPASRSGSLRTLPQNSRMHIV